MSAAAVVAAGKTVAAVWLPTTATAGEVTAIVLGHVAGAIAVGAFATLALIVWLVLLEIRAEDNPRRTVRIHHRSHR